MRRVAVRTPRKSLDAAHEVDNLAPVVPSTRAPRLLARFPALARLSIAERSGSSAIEESMPIERRATNDRSRT